MKVKRHPSKKMQELMAEGCRESANADLAVVKEFDGSKNDILIDRKQLLEIMKKIKADSKKMGADLAWYIDIRKLISMEQLLEVSKGINSE